MFNRSLRFLVVALLIVGVVTMGTMALAQSPSPTGSPAAASSPATGEVIPPAPMHFFSDYAGVTSPNFAIDLDRRMERFEHETANQFVVVVYPKLQSAAPIGDYCRRVFNAWGVGQKGINNGCVLFVFVNDHKLYIRVGSGLQPPLTDAVCEQIAKQTAAIFHQGDLEKGITAAVDEIIKAIHVQPPHHTTP